MEGRTLSWGGSFTNFSCEGRRENEGLAEGGGQDCCHHRDERGVHTCVGLMCRGQK